MAIDIPGYYFDPERKRYYKIEATGTAPATALWTSDNVRRRVAEEALAVTQGQQQQQAQAAAVLQAPLMGGFLARELGGVPLARPAWHFGRYETPAAAFAQGLFEIPCAAGSSASVPNPDSSRGGLLTTYVAGYDAGDGMSVMYRSFSNRVSCLIATLFSGYSYENRSPVDKMTIGMSRAFSNYLPETICYHAPTDLMVVPCTGSKIVALFEPVRRGNITSPALRYYEHMMSTSQRRGGWGINASVPAPSGSPYVCALATDYGLITLRLESDSKAFGSSVASGGGHVHAFEFSAGYDGKHDDGFQSVDFRCGHPHVVYGGGRLPSILMVDVRLSAPGYNGRQSLATRQGPAPIPHRSSVAQVRSLDEYRVLAAGPYSAMCVYDVRWYRSRRRSRDAEEKVEERAAAASSRGGEAALVSMENYSNGPFARGIGLDVERNLGIVAAATDRGTVELYSTGTGRQLPCAALRSIRQPHQCPVKFLQFQTLVGEKTPSLFAAVGGAVRKFSFGVSLDEDW